MKTINSLEELLVSIESNETSIDHSEQYIDALFANSHSQKEDHTDSLLFFTPEWQISNLTAYKKKFNHILIFDFYGKSEFKNNPNIISVSAGNNYQEITKTQYKIDFTKSGDFKNLFDRLAELNRLPELTLFYIDTQKTKKKKFNNILIEKNEKSIFLVFHLLKACLETKSSSCNDLYFIQNGTSVCNPFFSAINGFSRSIQLIQSKFRIKTFWVSDNISDTELLEKIKSEYKESDFEIKYENHKRWVRKLSPISVDSKENDPIRKKGTYIITGGCGSLGKIFSKYLVEKYHANIILLGSSQLDSSKQQFLDELSSNGVLVEYFRADISDFDAMKKCFESLKNKFPDINGIIHAAGRTSEIKFHNKDFDEFKNILSPKISGTIILDELTKNIKLDFFMMFSSISAYLGDFGQCDYAIGNRFQEAYGTLRQEKQLLKERSGKTIVVNWPLWKEGGMHMNNGGESLYLNSSGLQYLSTKNGILAFEKLLQSDLNKLYVFCGKKENILRSTGDKSISESKTPLKTPENTKTIIIESAYGSMKEQVEHDLTTLASGLLHVPLNKADLEENLGNMGFDSILLKEFAVYINQKFNVELMPTIFYEKSSLKELAKYMYDEHKQILNSLYQTTNVTKAEITKTKITDKKSKIFRPVGSRRTNSFLNTSNNQSTANGDIAIIGIDCLLPGANSLSEFWNKLIKGADLISEVPVSRWNWKKLAEKSKDAEIYRFGGFIEHAQAFDAAFFNISPREAELMDPQQRKLLETVWKAIEDAGYKASSLSGKEIGLFVGAESSDYEKLLIKNGITSAQMSIGNHQAVLANRISYLLNFNGPSITINTACSSSAVALHQAVRSLQLGESKMAIAAGVNLILSPQNILDTVPLGILSKDGKCKTFDSKANGYVKGEGVVAVMLKPFEKAMEDGDNIYALVKNTSVNHGGKANSLTAPNSEAQAKLIVEAYSNKNIDIESISYIEAHGTGTELGDPVEIEGLTKAFKKLEKMQAKNLKTATCGIGSVKTNIGHLEPVSGLAGLLKVIASLKHKEIPQTIHCKNINPYINLKYSPFYIVDSNKKWKAHNTISNKIFPLRAGLSSFGFGGVNAHIVLEEYETSKNNSVNASQNLFVLSAKTGNNLIQYAQSFIDFLRSIELNQTTEAKDINSASYKQIKELVSEKLAELINVDIQEIDIDADISELCPDIIKLSFLINNINDELNLSVPLDIFSTTPTFSHFLNYVLELFEHKNNTKANNSTTSSITESNSDIHNIAFTLQTGREEMNYRLAILASSIKELIFLLQDYINNPQNKNPFIICGTANNTNTEALLDINEDEGKEYLRNLFQNNKLIQVAKLWVSGIDINWNLFYSDFKPNKISLPTYPFSKNIYWAIKEDNTEKQQTAGSPNLHPLVGTNTSTLSEQSFTTAFTGNEFFLADHVINSSKVLPGVAYIEMARAAASLSMNEPVTRFKNILWSQPFIFQNDNQALKINIFPENDIIKFQVSSSSNQQKDILHSQGNIFIDTNENAIPPLNLAEIKTRCQKEYSTKEYYNLFKKKRLDYGESFRCIQNIYYNTDESISKIALHKQSVESLYLHPSILDASLQTVMLLSDPTTSSTLIPYSIESITNFSKIPDLCYAYVSRTLGSSSNKITKYTVSVCDSDGNICLELKNCIFLEYNSEKIKTNPNETDIINYTTHWINEPLKIPDNTKNTNTELLIYSNNEKLFKNIERDNSNNNLTIISASPGKDFEHNNNQYYLDINSPVQNQQLFKSLAENLHSVPNNIVYLADKENNLTNKNKLLPVFQFTKTLLSCNLTQNVRLFFVYNYNDLETSAVAAFFHSVRAENSKFDFTCVAIESFDNINLLNILTTELSTGNKREVAYFSGERKVKKIVPLEPYVTLKDLPNNNFKQKGVYLISGGLGGLGLILSKHLLHNYSATLILTGRSLLSAETEQKLESLRLPNSNIEYYSVDISNQTAVSNLVEEILHKHGKINGIIHCAGTTKDSTLSNKTEKEINQVLLPKIAGTQTLDKATKDIEIDFFILFSSVTGAVGNAGQSDYAYANRYLNCFAEEREKKRKSGKRFGNSLSINWPYWENGGMTISNESVELMQKVTGFYPIKSNEGIIQLEAFINQPYNSVIVTKGSDEKIKKFLTEKFIINQKSNQSLQPNTITDKTISSYVLDIIANQAGQILKVDINDLDIDEDLHLLGFDSITLTEFCNKINAQINTDITPAVFFELEKSTISHLSSYILDNFKEQINNKYKQQNPPKEESPKEAILKTEPNISVPKSFSRFLQKPQLLKENQDISPVREPVAIIGMSGMMPQSENLDQFWEQIRDGKDLISEVPKDRWDWKSFSNLQNGKWGGFMKEADKFDNEFFGISPREAELMDPQQRLFLQTVWLTIEDSGYKVSDFSGSKTGIFVGVTTKDYADILRAKDIKMQAYESTGTAHSILANRISYLLNLNGPSEPIDTACSSSLIAIHRAVESIQNGNCSAAIAGGVNVIASPNLFFAFNQAGMISKNGRCRTFDEQADGYVRGEGVAAILLKPLSKAINDQDNIYGIIKSTSENHGGHAHSLTAPNGIAQSELLIDAYKKAKIDPETISYLEAHGTGTKLGDPVEINALKKAFNQLKNSATKNNHSCGIGSVKTNIGHLESAAGIAGVVKVLLAMKHKQIPPNVHFSKLNSHIQLDDSPFYILSELKQWNREKDSSGEEIPRRAGISSFGFGGANSHVVIEEYSNSISNNSFTSDKLPILFVLSAKTKNSLLVGINQYLNFLKQHSDINLFNLAYTLQTGRDVFDFKLAIVANDLEELIDCLEKIASNKTLDSQTNIFLSSKNNNDESVSEDVVSKNFKEQNWKAIAECWIKGAIINWNMMYKNSIPAKISLPGYPFEKNSFWILNKNILTKENQNAYTKKLHIVIDSNESDYKGLRFKKTFIGNEFFLTGHGQILPAVVYLEMVHVAALLANKQQKVSSIKNIVLPAPIVVDRNEPKEVTINLGINKGVNNFKISTLSKEKSIFINSHGIFEYQKSVIIPEKIDPVDIINRCEGSNILAQEYYAHINSVGGNTGEEFRGISEFYFNSKEAIAKLDIPSDQESDIDKYDLHPTLTDSGIQSAVAFGYKTVFNKDYIYLPYVLGEVNIFSTSEKKAFAYIQQNYSPDNPKFSVTYLSKQGEVLMEINGLVFRPVDQSKLTSVRSLFKSSYTNHFYTPSWIEAAMASNVKSQDNKEKLLLLNVNDNQILEANRNIKLDTFKINLGDEYKIFDKNNFQIDPLSSKDYKEILLNIIQNSDSKLSAIIQLNSKNNSSSPGNLAQQTNQCISTLFFFVKEVLSNQNIKHLNLLCYYSDPTEIMLPAYEAIGGFLKSVTAESKKLSAKLLGFSLEPKLQSLINELREGSSKFEEIRYQKDQRYIKKYNPFYPDNNKAKNTIDFKKNGTYLIIGGMGDLGTLISTFLNKQYNANIVISGRKESNEEILSLLTRLSESGNKASYIQADITELSETENLIHEIKNTYGSVDGIIHCAGIIEDALFINKTYASFKKVISPKVQGTINLDHATRRENLDFIMFFSSISGVFGNIGQSDYAYANSFLDAYSEWRNKLVSLNKRSGKTISISWPQWEDIGMQMNSEIEQTRLKVKGIKSLPKETGLDIFSKSLSLNTSHLVVLYGETEKLNCLFKDESKTLESINQTEIPDINSEVSEKFSKDLFDIIINLLKIDQDRVSITENIDRFGFDSITFTELAETLNSKYNTNITPDVFFEHKTIISISNYLLKNYTNIPLKYHSTKSVDGLQETISDIDSEEILKESSVEESFPFSFEEPIFTALPEINKAYEPIAIIGMSGIMPQSENLDIFWDHLIRGHNLITEIPEERWNWSAFAEKIKGDNKSAAKWGAFIKDIDKFDPLFFNISPKEAELLDPQLRIFMQTTWKTIEDAGYAPKNLSGSNTGVFVGATTNDYNKLIATKESGVADQYHFMIANRISYQLDLRGPSESIDTACSSSLVAIHRAIESLHSGNCDMAIAGGVNALLDPALYIAAIESSMLSKDGRCFTFDERANGFVRGEGSGAILLKPFSKAKQDGDHIYAVIKGSSENHNGITSSPTTPNPVAQADLIVKTFAKANFDPKTITYIETHGTGTSLGDPIEINGLKKAFDELYKKHNYKHPDKHIALGSVKTNIGHLESAAGISGLLKVILAMKHGQIPGNINLQNQNPYIKLDDSPFYFVKDSKNWNHLIDDKGNKIPYRSGVSSFGIGGTNAHILLEEYTSNITKQSTSEKQIILLSSEKEDQLKTLAHQLNDFIQSNFLTKKKTEHNSKKNEVILILQSKLQQLISKILHVDIKEIEPDEDLRNFGFETIHLSELVQSITEYFSIGNISFSEVNTFKINSIANLLINKYPEKIIGNLFDNSYETIPEKTQNPEYQSCSIQDIAYTLQVGRDSFSNRLAIVAENFDELSDSLTAFCNSQKANYSYYFKSNVSKSHLFDGATGNEMASLLFKRKEWDKLAELWINGNAINWNILYKEKTNQRIPLPTYPFSKERYWIDFSWSNFNFQKSDSVKSEPLEIKDKHLHENESTELTTEDYIKNDIAKILNDILSLKKEQINLETSLMDYGFNSITLTEFVSRISKQYTIEFPMQSFFDLNPQTLNNLINYLITHHSENIEIKYSKDKTPIASTDKAPKKQNEEQTLELKESSLKQTLSFFEIKNKVESEVIELASKLLKHKGNDYDRDSVKDFLNKLNSVYNLSIPENILLEQPSIGAFVKTIIKKYKKDFSSFYNS